jgi:hypothetical protein
MVSSTAGLGTECDCAGEVQLQVQSTDPLYRQGMRHILKNHKCLKIISVNGREKIVVGRSWWPDTRTDWPTDHRSCDKFDFDHTSSLPRMWKSCPIIFVVSAWSWSGQCLGTYQNGGVVSWLPQYCFPLTPDFFSFSLSFLLFLF